MDYSVEKININEGKIQGEKPNISTQKNKLLKMAENLICKFSLLDENGFFCQIIYNNKKYNVLIIKNKILNEETFKKQEYLKIKYKDNIFIISIKNKILDINPKNIILNINPENKPYYFIEINYKEINDFYEIKGNFNGDFNEEIENKIKKEGNKYICEILFPFIGTGFICKIPYNNNNINVLFTNNHIINKDLLSKGKK